MTDKSDEHFDTTIRPAQAQIPDFVGRQISHYQILERVGAGGMGVVYKAEDTKLRRLVALKFLPLEQHENETAKTRFIREAQAASAIDHPNICNVHEIDETEDGRLFMALAYYEGETLRERLQRTGPLAVEEAINVAVQTARGLEIAHAHGLVHRDIKPANLILTRDGIVKILDFGLVKIEGGLNLTGVATAVGTVAYMSPEQTRAGEAGPRTDVWSLGVVLYEMLTAELPFKGDHPQSTIYSIRNDTPRPLSKTTQRLALRGSSHGARDDLASSPLLAPELQRIVDKCLAKDPEARYPSMSELISELKTLQDHPGSTARMPVLSRLLRARFALWAPLVAVVLLLGAVLLLRRSSPPEPLQEAGAARSVGVLYFQNNTGDPELDWLRTALTDLLVTDLAQSPHLEILATDRLYQILKDMNRLDENITSSEVVQEVASRGKVNDVLLGSFVRAGERIRINVTLQEARSSKILMTEWVEGVGESSIFSLVDDLNQRIKAKLEVPETANEMLDRGLKDVTTSSLDAYRHYADGIWLHERGRYDEAIAFYQKALAVDPRFAMALSKLSRALYAQGRIDASEDYAAKALNQVDRLSAREHYYIEGAYNGIREENYARAIEAYTTALELYPDHAAARFDLARRYLLLERYPEAIRELEELQRRGSTLPETYGDLSYCYAAQGDFEKGYQILKDFLDTNPDSSGGYFWLGLHLTRWGRLDEALEAYRKEAVLAPSDELWAEIGRWYVFLLRDQWENVESSARHLASSSDLFFRQSGLYFQVVGELYRGRAKAALALIERALADYPERGLGTADLRSLAAYIIDELDLPTEALEQAREAEREGKGHRPEWQGLFSASVARARLGESEQAEKVAEALRGRTAAIPTDRLKAIHSHLEGELALREGDPSRALEKLEKARALLPPHGLTGPPTESPPAPHIPHHVPIWFSTASAYWAAGNQEEAARWFRRIAESTNERINWPIPYVRSFYFLGKYYEARGQMDEARAYYRRFVDLWKEGDLDRQRVQEAQGKL